MARDEASGNAADNERQQGQASAYSSQSALASDSVAVSGCWLCQTLSKEIRSLGYCGNGLCDTACFIRLFVTAMRSSCSTSLRDRHVPSRTWELRCLTATLHRASRASIRHASPNRLARRAPAGLLFRGLRTRVFSVPEPPPVRGAHAILAARTCLAAVRALPRAAV
jgi:hypothetical protein